jgi:hypothetical protein
MQTDATPDVAPPAYSSPGDYAGEQSEPKSSIDEESRFDEQSTFTAPIATTTIKKSEPSRGELKQQLVQAENLISQLKNKEEQGGLRQRKTDGSAEEKPITKAAELTPQAIRTGTEGVPIHYVAILCLLSFLLAYFFF